MCEKVSREIYFGNDKGKSRVGFLSEMTKNKSRVQTTCAPYFCFFCHSRRESQAANANLAFNQNIITFKNTKIYLYYEKVK